jgi:hypothetical protein
MDRKMTPKQIEYETRRAKAANLTLEQWLRKKSATEAAAKTAEAPKPKKPSLLGRLIDRGHKPLKANAEPAAKPEPKAKRKG